MKSKRDRCRDYTICLLLLGITLAAFAGVLHNGFVNYDDTRYVSSNRNVKAGLSARSLVWAFASTTTNWFPVTWLSHLLDGQLFGLAPAGHHATSLLFHAANVVLLFFLLQTMTGVRWRSAMVAALFAVHPLHVESVAWVSERKDVLSMFFGLLTIGAYVRYARESHAGKHFALAMVFFALGLMSKPMLVTLPILLLLLDYWPLCRLSRSNALARIAEKIPLFVLSAVSCLVTMMVQTKGGAIRSLQQFSFSTRCANALTSAVGYLEKMAWPEKLSVFYPHPQQTLLSWPVAGCAFLLLCISALAVSELKKKPYLAVGWLWYLISLLPVIGLVQVGWQAMADRYTYIPLLGIYIMLSWGAEELAVRWRFSWRMQFVLAGLVVTALVARTVIQVQYWKDSISLFSRALAITSNNWLAHHCMADALAGEGKIPEALYHYGQALRIRPDYERAHNNLGVLAAGKGNFAKAVQHYSDGLRCKPNDPDIQNNCGNALEKLGRIDEAMAHYKEALRLDPDHIGAHNNMGIALAARGDLAAAVEHYRRVLELEPDYASAHNNLGLALCACGKLDEAFAQYAMALRIDPRFANAHYNLGILLAGQGREPEAIAEYSEALKITPDDPDAHTNLGPLLARRGDKPQALRHFSEALRLKPDHPQAKAAIAAVGK